MVDPEAVLPRGSLVHRPSFDFEKLSIVRDYSGLDVSLSVVRRSGEGRVSSVRISVDTEPPPWRHPHMPRHFDRTGKPYTIVYEFKFLRQLSPLVCINQSTTQTEPAGAKSPPR